MMYATMYVRMSRMIRKQVYLEQRHDRMLKRRARQNRVTEAEVIREILDRSEIAGTARTRAIVDPDAGHKLLAFIRSLRARPSQSRSRRRLNRDSLYEDRIGRWTRS